MRHGIAVLLAMLLTIMAVAFVGCDDDSTNDVGEVKNTIALQPVRLPTLKAGLVYEGWVASIDEDSNWVDYQSFGKFFWDEYDYYFLSPQDTTKRIDSTFTINGNAYSYDLIAITLEKHPVDNSEDPSPTVIAVSPIDPTQFTQMSFPADFSEGSGSFCIGTFSDGHYYEAEQPKSNEYSGLWFVALTSITFQGIVTENYDAGLDLPELPDTGYSYEGWVALDTGDTLSTGKFYYPMFQDYFNGHCLFGAIPNFPGEDFLQNPPAGSTFPVNVLAGGQAFISLEPNPDNDLDRPSNFIVLRGNLPITDSNVRNSSYAMANVAALEFPRINVFLSSK